MRGINRLACSLVVAAAIASGLAAAQPAAAASPWWRLSQSLRPSSIEAEGRGKIVLSIANLGDADANGKATTVAIADKLPAGLKPLSVKGIAGEPETLAGNRGPVSCPAKPTQSFTCTFSGTLPPFDQIELVIEVQALPGASTGEENEVSVSGAGAPGATLTRGVKIGGEPSFGVEGYELTPEEEGGAPATQAGSHPFQVTGSLTVNQSEAAEAVALPKELNGKLPTGLIGNPTPLPQCTLAQFLKIIPFLENECPLDSVVGVAMVSINERAILGVTTLTVPIFNVEPSVGEPARFGFYVPGTPVFLDPSVRTGGDYGITLGSTNISQTASLLAFRLTFWGVPGDPRHDGARGINCLETAREEPAPHPCLALNAKSPPPFLSLPTSCAGPMQTSIEAASWSEPSRKLTFPGAPMVTLDGCNRLSFDPSIEVTPDGSAGSTPTGLTVDVHVPQDSVLVANGLAESNVKGIAVTLPEGVALDPSGADGLEACSEGLVGFTGVDSGGVDHFTPTISEPFCPNGSKVGTATIHTPLLPRPLTGAVYLAAQNQNPFGSLIATYIVVEDPISGTIVKLAGEVKLSASGQIAATFQNNPQLAFEDAEIHFFGGARAPLATPARCGAYTTSASFEPWSGNGDVSSASSFQITSGPNGSACPGAALPFSPTLTGGTTNINGGNFSPLTTTIGRQDGQQDMQSVQLRFPPGVSGLLAGVKLCPEAQANEGTCGPESLIGETTVSAGIGSDPVSVKGGRVYITEKYAGAPFGLSIVNPVKTGPFDLERDASNPAQNPPCDCIVVRAKIEVDPVTAALTVTTDSSGPHAIPHLIDGVPVQIQKVNVLVSRPGFTFNPTSCNAMSIGGSIASDEGASSPVSVPFQVANCERLAFKPSFKVSTSGKTSRKLGASLKVNLAYPKAPFGSQANIKYVKVSLPRQLPSELKTLQHACPHETFEANPAGCPGESRVGYAKAVTPLLPVPVEGPAYFVSYGGQKFPELIMVLQGYGVTVDLHAETFINEKTGVTSSTLHTVPDVPVGTFELNLPQGPFSALGANGNLCEFGKTVTVKKRVRRRVHGRMRTVTVKVKKKLPGLTMPTRFIAQNGKEIKQNTPISVGGCPKAKKKGKGKK